MICQIIQNGRCILILCLFMCVTNSLIQEKITSIQEFCSENSFIRNVEPGEPFKLVFKSEQQSDIGIDKWYKRSKRKCRYEFKTSDPSAHFDVSMSNITIPSCDDNCRCNYFEITVPGDKKRFCGIKESDYFSSKSDKLSIEFHHGSTMRFDVSFMFIVERNVYIITGTSKEGLYSSKFIETPYFPISYPPNYRAEYILESYDKAAQVLLLFIDFQISPHSFIEVFGNNGTHPTRIYGDIFRPPVFVSESNQLMLKFQSNDQPGMPGFRALASFIKNAETFVPYTDCAEAKDSKGGYINIKTHQKAGLYDCMWHLVPFTPFSKANLSVFIHMRNISDESILEFRLGSNSKAELAQQIDCEDQDCNHLDTEIIVPASEYLYIKFNGYLDKHSVFNLSYSTYHIGNCSDKEFKCQDNRCLSLSLKCDGIAHCKEQTDEKDCPSSVFEDKKSSIQSIQTKSLHSEDSYKYIVLFGCLALAVVIAGISIITYKHYCKKPMITESSQNQTSGELTDVQASLYPVDPCNCDNPPSYDDFVKSSNFYPHLLYTSSSQNFTPKNPCSQCTTSFCSGARMRHYSADSFAPRTSDTSSGDIFLNISGDSPHLEQPPSPNVCNVEIIQNNLSFKTAKNTIKRSYSLDSKLNDLVNHDSCHLLLSIVHPSCTHDLHHYPQVQWYTLPPNFRYKTFETCNNNQKMNEPSWLQLDSNVNVSKDRRFTCSFVPRNSANTELITVVKTRCFSEPCKSISIHYSLY